MIAELIFWISVGLLFHSYVLYPLSLRFLSIRKKDNTEEFEKGDDLPMVSVLMSVHNEEKVLNDKIRSIFYTLYPHNKLEVLIGSDASTDGTNYLLGVLSANYPQLRFISYPERQGKPSVINQLVKEAKGSILVLTDAKVFLEIDTIPELIKPFRNEKITAVGGNLVSKRVSGSGISFQEKTFMDREIKIKYHEGLIWGKTIGVYGAIYAIRKEAISPVPEGYSVDDFFISMKVLQNGGSIIMNTSAVAVENVPDDLKMEFRRKVRISAGNFKNLVHFSKLLLRPWTSLFYAYFSHKVIRWIGPFLILSALVSTAFLAPGNQFWLWMLLIQLTGLILPLLDFCLRKINRNIILLRFATHFYAMNLALLTGFFKYILGIKTHIWQPTKR